MSTVVKSRLWRFLLICVVGVFANFAFDWAGGRADTWARFILITAGVICGAIWGFDL